MGRQPVAAPIRRPVRGALEIALVAAGALSIGVFLVFGDAILLVLPLVPIAAVAAARRPELAVGGVFVLLGFPATLSGHTPIPTWLVVHLLVAGLWAGAFARYMFGSRPRSTWIWPGMLLPGLYVAVTGAQMLISDHKGNALLSFRTSTYFLVIALLIALAPWARQTYVRMTKAVVLVGLAVGAYAILRYIIGPSGAEDAIAREVWASLGRPRFIDPEFHGSFGFSRELSGFAAAVIPFVFAVLLGGLGRRRVGQPNAWQLLAGAALATLAFALLASGGRTGLLAAVGGSLVVLMMFAIAPPIPSGRRIGTIALAILALMLGGAGIYALVVTEEQDRARYGRLSDPGNDPTYQTRLDRWDSAIEIASTEPFGHGLGTQGQVGQERAQGIVGPPHLDSSYLKIAIEQGFFVLGLYLAALLSLLLGLIAFVRRTRGRTEAVLSIAGAGALVAAAVLFYSAFYIEGVVALPIWIMVGIGIAMPATRLARRAGASP